MRYSKILSTLFVLPLLLVLACGGSADERPSDEQVIEMITEGLTDSGYPGCINRQVDSVEILEWGNPQGGQEVEIGGKTYETTPKFPVRTHIYVRCDGGMLSEAGARDYRKTYEFGKNEFDEWEYQSILDL